MSATLGSVNLRPVLGQGRLSVTSLRLLKVTRWRYVKFEKSRGLLRFRCHVVTVVVKWQQPDVIVGDDNGLFCVWVLSELSFPPMKERQ